MFSRYVTSNSLPWFWLLSYDPYHKRLVDDFTNTFAVFRSQMWVKIKLHSHKLYIPTMLIYPPVCCELNRQWLSCHVLGLWWNNFSKYECMFGVIIDITSNINVEPKNIFTVPIKSQCCGMFSDYGMPVRMLLLFIQHVTSLPYQYSLYVCEKHNVSFTVWIYRESSALDVPIQRSYVIYYSYILNS